MRRMLRGLRPRISATCSHVSAPLRPRTMTSWTRMARSIPSRVTGIATSLVATSPHTSGRTSGHLMCPQKRPYDVLSTLIGTNLDRRGLTRYLVHHAWTSGGSRGRLHAVGRHGSDGDTRPRARGPVHRPAGARRRDGRPRRLSGAADQLAGGADLERRGVARRPPRRL